MSGVWLCSTSYADRDRGWVNWGHARAALVDDPKSVPQGDELFWDKDQSDLIAAH